MIPGYYWFINESAHMSLQVVHVFKFSHIDRSVMCVAYAGSDYDENLEDVLANGGRFIGGRIIEPTTPNCNAIGKFHDGSGNSCSVCGAKL